MLSKILFRALQDVFSLRFWRLVAKIVVVPFVLLAVIYAIWGGDLMDILSRCADVSVKLFEKEWKPLEMLGNKIVLWGIVVLSFILFYWLFLLALTANSIDFIISGMRKEYYSEVPLNGFHKGFRGMFLLLGRSLKYLAGYLLLLPLFLIPLLGFLVSFLYTAYVLDKTLLYEAAGKVLNKEEFKNLLSERKKERIFLSFLGSLLNYIPLGFFFAPLFQAIIYLHFVFLWKENRIVT